MPTCQWIAKNGRVEGSSADGNSEQMAVATVAAVLCILPGISMIISSMIRNERTIFTLLETGKYAIALDLILLVLGSMDMDRITWDCRWYTDVWNPNYDRCRQGYSNYILGVTILFTVQAPFHC